MTDARFASDGLDMAASLVPLLDFLEDVPLPNTIEEAVEPLIHATPVFPDCPAPTDAQLDVMASFAKSQVSERSIPTWDTPYHEVLKQAIYLYTMEDPYKLYLFCNAALNAKDKRNTTFLAPYSPFYKLLMTACMTLPPELRYVGRAWRVIRVRPDRPDTVQWFNNYNTYYAHGKPVYFGAFTSMTEGEDVAESLSASGSQVILLKFASVEGYNIAPLSAYGDAEKEVLVLPPSSFVVTACKKVHNTVIVDLKPAQDTNRGQYMRPPLSTSAANNSISSIARSAVSIGDNNEGVPNPTGKGPRSLMFRATAVLPGKAKAPVPVAFKQFDAEMPAADRIREAQMLCDDPHIARLLGVVYEDNALGHGTAPPIGLVFALAEIGRSAVRILDIDAHGLPQTIGDGGTSRVYRAEATMRGVDQPVEVALKLYKPHVDKTARNEVTAMARLLNVAEVVRLVAVVYAEDDTGALDHTKPPVGLALELMSGTLAQYLEPTTATTPKAAHYRPHSCDKEMFMLFGVVCRAVRALHSQNIVHGDLKLDNFLTTSKGEPKLADLGSSRVMTMTGRSTVTTGAAGTPLFMAPECCAGEPPTKESDVFSMGMCMWAMLHIDRLRTPFGDSYYQMPPLMLMNKIINGDRPAMGAHVPKALRELIESCWNGVVASRPTIDTVLSALQRIEAHEFEATDPQWHENDRPHFVFARATELPTVEDVLPCIGQLIPEAIRPTNFSLLQQFVDCNEDRLIQQYPGLSRNNIAALHAYTMSFNGTPYRSLYESLNEALQERPHAADAAFAPYAPLYVCLLDALRRIPTVRYSRLYRGMTRPKVVVYAKGTTVYLMAPTSTSENHAKAMEFAGPNGAVMQLRDVEGYPVRDFSMYPDENEVLLPPNTCIEMRVSLTGEEAKDAMHMMTGTSLQVWDVVVAQCYPMTDAEHPLRVGVVDAFNSDAPYQAAGGATPTAALHDQS